MIRYETRDYWEKGYQDSSVKSSRTYAVCACGWELCNHSGYYEKDSFRISVLEHQVSHLVELVSADPTVKL